MEENRIPWSEIGVYLRNRSDKEAEATIKAWLKESPDNVNLLKEIHDTHQITRKDIEFYQPNAEALWRELVGRIQAPQQSKVKSIQLSLLKYAAVAAVVAIAFLAGKFFNATETNSVSQNQNSYAVVLTEPGQRSQIILPDSTKVWLNSGSQIKYASGYDSQNRDVYIKGECYFEVTKDVHKPFVVHGKDLQVKVYGTHFNVKENDAHEQSEVTLVEGKVEVLDTDSKSLAYLKPGEQLTLKGRNCQVNQANNPEALIAWTHGILVFEDMPFEQVVEYLESWYGVSINLAESLYSNYRYTFKLKTESLREVLDLISVITPIQYKIEGEQVYINSKKES